MALHAFDRADKVAKTIAANMVATPWLFPETHWAGIDCGCGVSFSFQDSHGRESEKDCRQKTKL
jgi:hypothetical protein